MALCFPNFSGRLCFIAHDFPKVETHYCFFLCKKIKTLFLMVFLTMPSDWKPDVCCKLFNELLKYGFCDKSFQKDEPLTSWTLFLTYLSSKLLIRFSSNQNIGEGELELVIVSKELNHFGVIACLFRQIGGHT